MRISRWMISATILGTALIAQTARAQRGEEQLLREGANFNSDEENPHRPLTVRAKTAEVFAGVNLTLHDEGALKPFSLPAGFGYGVIDNLELGAEVLLFLNRPDPLNFAAVGEPRIYGRYAFLPGMLAAEASIFIPDGKDLDALGFRLEAPFRYNVSTDFLLLAAATYSGFFGDEYQDFEQIGATGIYSFMPRFWAGLELGLTLRNFRFEENYRAIPLGIFAGYEISEGLAILPGFRFPDLAHTEFRTLSVIVAYTMDLFGGKVAEGKETPEIPIPGRKNPDEEAKSRLR